MWFVVLVGVGVSGYTQPMEYHAALKPARARAADSGLSEKYGWTAHCDGR